MSRQFELASPPFSPFPSFITLQQTVFFQLCFSVKTISSSPWTSARPRPCRLVSPMSTALNPWWKTGLSFYVLPLPQLSLLAPPCGDQGWVARDRVSPTSNKSRGHSTKSHTGSVCIFTFLMHFCSSREAPFQASGEQPEPPPSQLSVLGLIRRNSTTRSFRGPREVSPSRGKGTGFGRNLSWVEGVAGFLGSQNPLLWWDPQLHPVSSCLLVWLWEEWRTNFMVSSAGHGAGAAAGGDEVIVPLRSLGPSGEVPALPC